jgi:hypothetical protein
MAQPVIESKGLIRFKRLAQPLHCEVDVGGLQMAPALDFPSDTDPLGSVRNIPWRTSGRPIDPW